MIWWQWLTRSNRLPELCRFNGISFRIHADHLPPHIHVRYSGALPQRSKSGDVSSHPTVFRRVLSVTSENG